MIRDRRSRQETTLPVHQPRNLTTGLCIYPAHLVSYRSRIMESTDWADSAWADRAIVR